jgi:hypothetical protein
MSIASGSGLSGSESERGSGVLSGESRRGKGLMVSQSKEVQAVADFDESEWEWMGDFDWDADLKDWEMGKSVTVNPIQAVFGNLVNCSGLTINWSGNFNFRS